MSLPKGRQIHFEIFRKKFIVFTVALQWNLGVMAVAVQNKKTHKEVVHMSLMVPLDLVTTLFGLSRSNAGAAALRIEIGGDHRRSGWGGRRAKYENVADKVISTHRCKKPKNWIILDIMPINLMVSAEFYQKKEFHRD